MEYKGSVITFSIGILLIIFWAIVFNGKELMGIEFLFLGIFLSAIGVIWAIIVFSKKKIPNKT